MTIAANDPFRSDHVGDGALSTYPFGFAIFHKTHLRVIVLDPAAPPYATLAVDTDYDVDLFAKTITLKGAYAPLPTGHQLAIILNPALDQGSDIKNADAYHLDVAEQDQDRRVQQIRRQEDSLSRSLKLSPMEAGSDALTELPSLAERAGKILGFDNTGKPVATVQGPAPAEVQWEFNGQIATDQNANIGRYRARQDLLFTRFDVNFTQAGTGGNTVVNFLKNGVIVATVTVASGQRFGYAAANVSLVDGDELYYEVSSVSPTTPPMSGVMSARV